MGVRAYRLDSGGVGYGPDREHIAYRLDDAQVIARYSLDSVSEIILDSAAKVLFARQLEDIDAEMYEVRYARLEALELLPVKGGIGPGKDSYTFRMFDKVGSAAFTSDYAAGSIPRVDVQGIEINSRIRSIVDSYGYSLQEIRAAADGGLPLDSMRAATARRAINELLNSAMLLGSSEWGIQGLFSNPNVPTYAVQNGATSNHTLWMGDTTQGFAAKSQDEVRRDLFGIVDSIPTATFEVEHPTVLLLPYKLLRYASSAPLALGNTPVPVSPLEFFQKQRPNIKVRGALYLDNAGASGDHYTGNLQSRSMAYDPDRRIVEVVFPVPFESFPPQLRGLEWVTINHARVGSVVIRYPGAYTYADGM